MFNNSQLEIDFFTQRHEPFAIHIRENNSASEKVLNKRRDEFKIKCKKLLIRFCNGEKLTVLTAINSGISSLPRRALDLKESGFDVKSDFLNGADFKTWWMEEEEIKRVKEKFKEYLTEK